MGQRSGFGGAFILHCGGIKLFRTGVVGCSRATGVYYLSCFCYLVPFVHIRSLTTVNNLALQIYALTNLTVQISALTHTWSDSRHQIGIVSVDLYSPQSTWSDYRGHSCLLLLESDIGNRSSPWMAAHSKVAILLLTNWRWQNSRVTRARSRFGP